MKRLFLSLVLGVAAFYGPVVSAGPIHTAIIQSTGTTLTLTVNADRLLKIYDFVHDGANAGIVHVVKGTKNSDVLSSTAITAPESHRTFFVSGEATVTIAPPGAGNLTISYQFVDNTE